MFQLSLSAIALKDLKKVEAEQFIQKQNLISLAILLN